MKHIDPDLLRALLRYDPATGSMTWCARTTDMFKDGRKSAQAQCSAWNGKHADKPAFASTHTEGYLSGRIFQRQYYAHRVAWALHYGKWPDEEIDHINGDRADNRIENLRAVGRKENSKNLKTPSNNKSGVAGVGYNYRYRYWEARISVDRNAIFIGAFATKDLAISARKAAERKYGFHKNHGRAA